MIVALTLLLTAKSHRPFDSFQMCDWAHRTSWDEKGRRSLKFGIPLDMEKMMPVVEERFADQLVKAHHGTLTKTMGANPGWRTAVVRIARTKNPEPSVRMRFGRKPESGIITWQSWTEKPNEWVAVKDLPGGLFPGPVPVSIGVASGRWHVRGTWDVARSKGGGVRFDPKLGPSTDLQGKPDGRKDYVLVEARIPVALDSSNWRLVGFDKESKAIPGAGIDRPAGKTLVVKRWFRSDSANLASLQLQTRDYVWTSFGSVPLNPNR